MNFFFGLVNIALNIVGRVGGRVGAEVVRRGKIQLERKKNPPHPASPPRTFEPDGKGGGYCYRKARERADGSFSQDIYYAPDINDPDWHSHTKFGITQDGKSFQHEAHAVKHSKWVWPD
jgi:hypothetical protein